MSKSKTQKSFFPKMGWIPDIPDARDFVYSTPRRISQSFPPKVDLRNICPPIYNQGKLGSCTANALTAAVECGKVIQKQKTFRLSRLFLYYNERAIMHTITSDSGAYLRDGIKSLFKIGVCPEKEWTYNSSTRTGAKFTKKPPPSCYQSALDHQVTSYLSLPKGLNAIKGCLAEGYPFAFGFAVYESFLTEEVSKSGIMPIPDITKESLIGGHAVLAVGYDDATRMVLVRNSWGKKWGLDGYFWMPYEYISNSSYCQDFWTIRVVE